MYPEASKLAELLEPAHNILILQADNPDGDSLGSALALEQILGDLGKEPYMYCGIDMPAHLKYLPGWDRVSKELPSQFDVCIVVDTSSATLFEQAQKSSDWQIITSKPCVVLDHHADTENSISNDSLVLNKTAVATGEVIYELAKQLQWPLNIHALNALAVSILSDSLGLMTDKTSARSIHVVAELVEAGVKLPEIENLRRELSRKSPELVRYKGELLQRIEYHDNDRIATITIPWEEIEKYSPEYNPSILAIDEMRMTTNTAIAVAFKLYPGGKITGKIRCNYGYPIGADLAATFGGGGHPYASGFKIQDDRSISDIKAACIARASELLDNLTQENHEVI